MTPERNDRNTILHVQCAGLLFLEWYGHRGQDEDWLLASPALTFQTGVCIGCPGGPELGCPGQGLEQKVRDLARAALSLLPAPGDFGLPTGFGAAGKAESIRWWEGGGRG